MNIKYESMGVINLTPDSFSDGAKFNTVSHFQKQFNTQSNLFDIVDIGAESTAPFNSAISAEEEMKRYQDIFFPILDKISAPNCRLSIDTYKPEVFKFVLNEVRKQWGRSFPIIFNDVSGKVDSSLVNLLRDSSFSYIFCHNLSDSRSSTSRHMDFVDKGSDKIFLENITNYFKDALIILEDLNTNVILDPCFGFSKTRNQNHLLLANIGKIFNQFNKQVMVGISRKSLLRNDNISLENQKDLSRLDVAQGILLNHTLVQLDQPPIFRVHDNLSLSGISIAQEVLSHCQKV